MKIYNEIVIDMNPESSTFEETLHENSFHYFGDMIFAQGGPGHGPGRGEFSWETEVFDTTETLDAYMLEAASDGYYTEIEWAEVMRLAGLIPRGTSSSLKLEEVAGIMKAVNTPVDEQRAIEAHDETLTGGMQNVQVSQPDVGISTAAVGSREELSRMLTSYLGRGSLIQTAQRQKAVYTIDRFDGGINLNKSPRDLAYWEACQMDELTPSKVGRLIRLGDFSVTATYDIGLADAEQENYGLYYFKWSDSVVDSSDTLTLAGVAPTNYLAYDSGDGGVELYNFTATDEVSNVIAGSTFDSAFKPVYHNADNRLYISDASFATSTAVGVVGTYTCSIIDRPNYFPFTHSDGSLQYNVEAGAIAGDPDYYSFISTTQPLYHAAPVAGITGEGNIAVTTNSTGYAQDATTHQGIYINVKFEDVTEDISSTGWGGAHSISPLSIRYYKFFASFLYDNGAETKLTDVTGDNNSDANIGTAVATATTTEASVYQKLVVKQVLIDVPSFALVAFRRVHGVRLYYSETDSTGKLLGNDKYQWGELDFKYGLKLVSEFGHWNLFEDEHGDADNTLPTAVEISSLQVSGAAETSGGGSTTPDGTLSITSPPTAFTYYTLNLFHQEELKKDLMWKTSTMGNGIAFIGNIQYEQRQYPDTMLYSGAGETDAGSAYPMWGVFPVDSNRIDIPGAAGEITALKWVANRVLQFRTNALYIVNVEDVLAPKVEGVYQGMGVFGQWAVTETAFGVAWVNSQGVYAYNAEEKKARSLTLGRLDTEDFIADSTSKIGYDDRAKMLIVGNYTKKANASNYAYAYSFVTDAWCTWSQGRTNDSVSNYAIDHEGYLTGGTSQAPGSNNIVVRKWSAEAQATATVDYITKDIDFGKPNLDKRFYTIYISYTGGASNEMNVYFRVNGREGKNLSDNWVQLSSILDFTDPYADSTDPAWATSGSPTTGDPYVPSADDGLDSTDTGEQKLAKINLRSISGSLPADYFKFARSIQLRFTGVAATTFEINDISLVYKEKRLK